jgi:transcriptional regulator GlxA family with amidase domain
MSSTSQDPSPDRSRRSRRQIGLLLFDGVEELDAMGPWEVLASWTQHHPEDGWDTWFISKGALDVIGAKGVVIGAHHSIEHAPKLDVLIHPGGAGARRLMRDQAHLEWIRQQRAEVPLMASVCTGSLVYAAAGLLTGRRATTHWASLNLLAELDPTVITDVDARFVDDGDVLTSAGVSAGIDMALHLVARIAGTERARSVRRSIQYDPQPPV